MTRSREFTKGKIHDVVVRPLAKFLDERGWLAELFRSDELDPQVMPVMAYLSMTQPGVARGPHEHLDQTDYFCFMGPSNFKVYLWDHPEHRGDPRRSHCTLSWRPLAATLLSPRHSARPCQAGAREEGGGVGDSPAGGGTAIRCDKKA